MKKDPFAEGAVPPTRVVAATRPPPPPARANALRLTVIAGAEVGRSAVIAQPVVLVGRAVGADFRVADPTVSAFHVELRATPSGIELRDLESKNGVRHAGALLRSAVVPAGATLELGGTRLRVDLDAPVAAAPDAPGAFGELRGADRATRELFATLARLAPTDLSVLIEGPTGTGKELVARALHAASPRAAGPFLVLDCTAIPGALAESVLLGYEKGAFTGAAERRAGIFEAAEGGTVFLDEIGELPLDLQPKLLRVLERREVVRVGGTQPHPVRVRVVAATWRDLRTLINQGRFREDLYYRLAQARAVIPPLRERPDDVPVLVEHFLAQLPADVAARSIAPEALAELRRREYAGNVRELKSTVERAALMSEGPVITAADLAFERKLMGEHGRATHTVDSTGEALSEIEGDAAAIATFRDAKRSAVDEFERDYLQRLLARTGGNISRAAAIAGVERHYLRALLRRQGLRDGA